jgi:RHS repeat-associated protein
MNLPPIPRPAAARASRRRKARLGTGLYNYGYRYYHPELGRWISRDPIGEKGGLNLYAFSRNLASKRIDAYGLRDFEHGSCVVLIEIGHVGTHIDDPVTIPPHCRYGAVGCFKLTDDINWRMNEWGVGVPGIPDMIESGDNDKVGPDLDENISPPPPGSSFDVPPPDADGGNGRYPRTTEGFELMLKDIEARAIEAARGLCKPPDCCKNPEVKFSCTSKEVTKMLKKYKLGRWCNKNFSVPC